MARLPQPGSDDNVWGDILNDFLKVEHGHDGKLIIRTDGTLDSFYSKPSTGIPASDLTTSAQTSLAKASSSIQTVNGHTPSASGAVILTKDDVGLAQVDDTSDANKPISAAMQAALDGKLNSDDAIALAVAL